MAAHAKDAVLIIAKYALIIQVYASGAMLTIGCNQELVKDALMLSA